MDIKDLAFRMLCAIICGFVIGLERQLRGHYSGIRTNVLVSLGSCLFVVFPMMYGMEVSRNSAQVITGVGFLGSGIIFKEGADVRGINTAATIWCTAAIGMLTSSGNFVFAALATIFVLLANILFRPISNRINPLSTEEEDIMYEIRVTCTEVVEFPIRGLIVSETKKLHLLELSSEDVSDHKVEIKAKFYNNSSKDYQAEQIVSKISLVEGVSEAGWKKTEWV